MGGNNPLKNFRNSIQHGIVCAGKEQPWMINEIKKLINERNLLTNYTAVLIEMFLFPKILNLCKTN